LFNEFIKNYNILRNILRECFLYGCYSREDLEKKMKISSRKISYEIRRIQQFIGKKYIKIDKYGRYNLLNLTYDFLRHPDNFLINTYYSKSFTKNDLILYFSILMYLESCNKEKDFNSIEMALIENGLISYENLSRKTLERKINEMCNDLTQIEYKIYKRKKFYKIAKDIFKSINNDELKNLFLAIKLFKNVMIPTTFGYFLEDTIIDYAKLQRNFDIRTIDCFNYSNLYYHPAIEEELLWTILKAIHNRKKIKINYKAKKSDKNSNNLESIVPYKIRFDVKYGRLYLVSILQDEYDNLKCIIIRIDRIEEIKVLKSRFKREEYNKLYNKYFEHSWSNAIMETDGDLEEVIFLIIINDDNDKEIIDKILLEVQNIECKKLEYGVYQFKLIVNDSLEILPWIRSYAGNIIVKENKKLKDKLYNDLEETLKSYGVV
jgi:predicted DNA-binding transcriptional regulator YafY